MAKYFNFFPKTLYSANNETNSLNTVTNIISRFAFEDSLKENSAAFYEYSIKDSDTPEIIAHKYYGHVERHWVVLLFNNIIDPQYGWPLKFSDFNEYVDAKYSTPEYADTANTSASGLTWAKNVSNVKSYFKVITDISSYDNTSVKTKIEIDSNAYANVAATSTTYTLENGLVITEKISKETQTYYDYEEELNESKRKIKLLKNDFVQAVEKEFKRVIR